MITIESGDPIEPTLCECCGGTTTTLTRFVYRDGTPYAIYFARFSDNHPERLVKLAVGLGEFGEGTREESRVGFALDLRSANAEYHITVTDPTASPWQKAKVLGPMLDRDSALSHPRIKEIFHITDHMVVDDPELRTYLEADARTSTPSSRRLGANGALLD